MKRSAHIKLHTSPRVGISLAFVAFFGCKPQTPPIRPCTIQLQNENALCFTQAPTPDIHQFSLFEIDHLYQNDAPELIIGSSDGTLRIFKTKPENTFEEIQTIEIGKISDIKFGDFNGDTLKDIISFNLQENNINILLNNENNNLIKQPTQPITGNIKIIESSDLNNDFFDDLVFYDIDEGSLKILINNKNNGFDLQNTLQTSTQTPQSLRLSDINSDSSIDIISHFSTFFEVPGSATIIIFTNNNGVFDRYEKTTEFDISDFEILDFNNDQLLDLVVSSGSNLYTLYNETSTSKGITLLSNPESIGFVENEAHGLRKTDFNNDGYIDIFGVSFRGITPLLNTQEEFIEASFIDFPNTISTIDLDADDLNGDLLPDLIVAGIKGDSLSIFLQIP